MHRWSSVFSHLQCFTFIDSDFHLQFYCPVSQYCEILLCLVVVSFTFYCSECLSIWVTASYLISQPFSRSFRTMLSNLGPRTGIWGTHWGVFLHNENWTRIPTLCFLIFRYLLPPLVFTKFPWGSFMKRFVKNVAKIQIQVTYISFLMDSKVLLQPRAAWFSPFQEPIPNRFFHTSVNTILCHSFLSNFLVWQTDLFISISPDHPQNVFKQHLTFSIPLVTGMI